MQHGIDTDHRVRPAVIFGEVGGDELRLGVAGQPGPAQGNTDVRLLRERPQGGAHPIAMAA